MAMQHTPGPWRWTDGDHDIDIAIYESPGYYNNPELLGADGECIVGCDEYWIIGPIRDRGVQTANALLIATSPELLAELTGLVEHFANCDVGPKLRERLVRARAVIAKATTIGETP